MGLAVIWPVLLVIAVGVKLSSPGPVLFRQQRLGRGGHPFRICKFRSMTVQNTGPSVTAGGDARVTPFGRFLRRTKLDELPQLLNVLAGQMSFVGPRPEVPEFAELYPQEYARILKVRPGITHPGTLRFRREEEILATRPDTRRFYIDEILPAKIAAYEAVLEQGLLQDIRTIVETIAPFMAAEPLGPENFAPAGRVARSRAAAVVTPAWEPVATQVANIPDVPQVAARTMAARGGAEHAHEFDREVAVV